MDKVTSFWCYKLSSYYSKSTGPVYEINLYVFCIFLFASISVALPHHCDILPSRFMYFNSLALFFFFFWSTLHLKNNFSLIGTRASSLSCVVLFPAPCCFSARPSAFALFPHSSCPWFLSSFFLWCSSLCFLFILPAKLNEVLHWEGAGKQQLACLEGYARSNTYRGILHFPVLHFIQGCMHSPFVKSQENEGAT